MTHRAKLIVIVVGVTLTTVAPVRAGRVAVRAAEPSEA